MTIDQSYKKLSTLRADFERAFVECASEQDARFKLINRFLTEVLGWAHEPIKTEIPTESGYADYTLFDASNRAIGIIEAKKIGALTIDTASTALTAVNIGGQVLKPASDGIQQAIRYCAEVGATYASLTDGERWIFFRAIRNDGQPPSTGKAFVFPSFTAVLEDFATFYELLAPDALAGQLHFARLNNLEGGHIRAAEPRYFIANPEDAHLLSRTDISRDIVDLFKRFFAAMGATDDDEMRKACFVDTPESREAETALSKITAHLTNAIQSLETEHGKELQAEIRNVVDSKIAEICLIVGGSGSGKSTFIERFFEDVLSSDLQEACVITTIDVSEFPGGNLNPEQWLAERLRDSYESALFAAEGPTYEDYMGMFFSTYQRWSNAIYRDLYRTNKDQFKIKFGEHVEERRESRPHEYAVGLLQHTIFGRKRLPCIIFDNVDRVQQSIQTEVMRYASVLKSASACFILISAGDRSVWRLSKSIDIQSYFTRRFFLPTPPVKEILSRRVGYIRAKLEGDERVSGEYFSAKGLKISIKNLGAFATVIEETLVNHPGISDRLGRLANFDIGQMLRLSERVISSPTLKVDDLVQSYFTPKGIAPFDERRVLGSMILGDYDRYSTLGNEFVINIFSTDGNYPYSPLLACSILQTLLSLRISNQSDVDASHMAVASLLNYFEPCGVARDETRRAIKQLFESKLVAPLDPSGDKLTDSTKVAITPRGHAHLDFAMQDEVYLTEMARVTGFRFTQTRNTVESFLQAQNVTQADSLFARQLLADDATKLRVPNVEGYSVLTKLRNEFAATWRATGGTAKGNVASAR